MRQPNIVLVMADQLGARWLPCYGHRVVQAPNIDRLANEGVVFDAAYTNSPLCAPSRFVMMSGRLPSAIAAWDNAVEFSSEVPTFAHYLHAAGYHTCLSGKMHFVGPDQLHGYQQRLTTDVYPADFTWHPDWNRPGERLDWFHNMNVVTQAGVCTRSMYLDYDDDALFRAERYLFERARAGDGQPFMLTVSFIQPHDPYLCREETWKLYDDAVIDLPTVPLGAVEEDPHSARLRHGYGASDVHVDDVMLRRARRAYYGSVSDIDAKVGRLLTALAEAGFADDTILVFTSDHGDMLGERGMWFKMSFFEDSARVPLIVHRPAQFAHRRVSQAVSLVDLLPTFLDFAGGDVEPATPIDGRSLAPHLHGEGGHDEVWGEYFAEGTDAPVFMLRRDGAKLIASERDAPLLYDLREDPHETHNIAADDSRRVEAGRAEIAARYDVAALSARVRESQQRRAFLKGVMRDQALSWDYAPRDDVANAYIRNTLPIYELEKRARFPEK